MLALLPALLLAAAPAPTPADAVRAADLALDAAVAGGDVAAFGALLEDDVIFAGGRRFSHGRAAVISAWKPLFSPGGPRLRWTPARAGVASSGDLAFTTGRWTSEVEGKDGKPVREEGEYVTVWRRGAGGAWRVLLDASLEPAAKLGAGLVRDPMRAATSAAGDLDAALGAWTRGAERGGYLVVRRRGAAGGGLEVVVDSAFRFEVEPQPGQAQPQQPAQPQPPAR